MDLPPVPADDVLAEPVRARLFRALAELRRPATTSELAQRIGRHANTTRDQLNRLAAAGLVEARQVRRPRGRPRQEWAIAAAAHPGGRPPDGHAELSRWLARALGGSERAADVEAAGRSIGRELAPGPPAATGTDAVRDALTALGFGPRTERAGGRTAYVLTNCPYREAVLENPALVCGLHRGLTRGLLDRLDPGSELADFVVRDPIAAGCVIATAPARA
jgi:predicted ArsR family transcriptional regulator